VTASAFDLAAWTHEAVHAECRDPYNKYSRELDDHYTAYFAAHTDQRGTHLRQAALPLSLRLNWETRRANDTSGFVLAAHPGKSQGRPGTPTGSQPIRALGLPDLRSPSKPLSRKRADATGRPGRSSQKPRR
jgi:hypothetical protein